MWEREPDTKLIAFSLTLWANYIESGDINLSAIDAVASGKQLKALSTEQMELVLRLRKLARQEFVK